MTIQFGSLSVSRETYDALELYAELLRKWNPKINLVSKNTLEDLWNRHFIDSAQIFSAMPEGCSHWVDLGSGGGFPGLVIAILAKELAPDLKVTLVESDTRKSAFLRTVLRETKCGATVVAQRIEKIASLKADVLSARALADLKTLLGFADKHLADAGICLFPKGHTWEKEVAEASDSWRFSLDTIKSETQDNAVILRINEIEHA